MNLRSPERNEGPQRSWFPPDAWRCDTIRWV